MFRMIDAARRIRDGFLFGGAVLACGALLGASAAEERPLWGEAGLKDNPIIYLDGETSRAETPPAGSLSGRNRVFSRVSEPTYTIHRAPAALANGVGLVICPGGGYVDVWLDREGHDLGLWLEARGVTSLVLKYRTNARAEGGRQKFAWEVYLPAVVMDARQSVAVLRRRASELGLDPKKIGVAGFSAGGHLAFSAGYDARYWGEALREVGRPDFVGLFYPWLWEGFEETAARASSPPPVFLINGGPDRVTPAAKCLDLCRVLLERKVPAELHIFGKGGHGFDLADGRGESAALWKASFIAWLQDLGFIVKP